ncbi:hypothetical protein PUMCH_000481 [Australozyma saopauloensis]|uniref:Type 1 phosphatases regulator n=1 Tax=Australozyma saopauloensis TaxID=291208 RepID=A0AAX4H428_9ASCO|nr:hypothetical protein PUMCH_000481 [[Candida] saopauloensis]
MTQRGTSSTASQTQTQTQTAPQEHRPVLHLRASDNSQEAPILQGRPRVRWTEDVVDNEHMDKKKSKICCIFHPQREFGESSDESLDSSSDSSDESGNEGTEGKAVGTGGGNSDKKKKKKHGNCCNNKKASSPNAYERQPNYKNQSVLPENAI